MKVPINSFHMNRHTLGFHPLTKKILSNFVQQTVPNESTAQQQGFQQNFKVRKVFKVKKPYAVQQSVPHESTAQWLSFEWSHTRVFNLQSQILK